MAIEPKTKLCVRFVSWTLVAATTAAGHPGSGVAVDDAGEIYFTDTGHAVWKIDANGKLTDFRGSRFHWLDIDREGRFSDCERSFGEWFERVTPKGAKPCVVQCSDFPFVFARDGNRPRGEKPIWRATARWNASTASRAARTARFTSRRTPAAKPSRCGRSRWTGTSLRF
jgi:hypothetical protein